LTDVNSKGDEVVYKIYGKFALQNGCPSGTGKLGIKNAVVDLGTVELLDDISSEQRQILKENLLKTGLEVLDDKKSILIEKIKNVVIEMIHYSDEFQKKISQII
jgi:hypothetical protein